MAFGNFSEYERAKFRKELVYETSGMTTMKL